MILPNPSNNQKHRTPPIPLPLPPFNPLHPHLNLSSSPHLTLANVPQTSSMISINSADLNSQYLTKTQTSLPTLSNQALTSSVINISAFSSLTSQVSTIIYLATSFNTALNLSIVLLS